MLAHSVYLTGRPVFTEAMGFLRSLGALANRLVSWAEPKPQPGRRGGAARPAMSETEVALPGGQETQESTTGPLSLETPFMGAQMAHEGAMSWKHRLGSEELTREEALLPATAPPRPPQQQQLHVQSYTMTFV